MKRQMLIITCDKCGVTVSIELCSNAGQRLEATTHPGNTLEKIGWRTRPVQGASKLMYQDICPTCKNVSN